MIPDELLTHVKLAEGFSAEPYFCPAGYKTIGYGHNLDDAPLFTATGKLVDHMTEAEATAQMLADLQAAWTDLHHHLPWITNLDPVRRSVLHDMCFNMGWPTLSTFKDTLRAVQDGRYQAAAAHMKASRWYRQVGHRSRRLVPMMDTGTWPAELLRAA